VTQKGKDTLNINDEMHLELSVSVAVLIKGICAILISFLETKSTSSLRHLLEGSSGKYYFLVIKYFQQHMDGQHDILVYLVQLPCIPEVLG
jgi:hypothetical protein